MHYFCARLLSVPIDKNSITFQVFKGKHARSWLVYAKYRGGWNVCLSICFN